MIPRESDTIMRAGFLILAAGLAAAGCKGSDSAAEEKAAAPPPVVLGPEGIAVADSVSLATGPLISGALVPETSAQMRAEIAGAVLQVYAEEGQRVRRGEVLARLDDTALREAQLSARAAMRSAESAAQLAKRNEERAVRLSGAGAIAERELEQARLSATSAAGALADARARLVSAERQLAKATIRAPFNGVVAEQAVNSGDVVQIGALTYTIVDPASMRLEASVPASEVSALSVPMPVDFTVTGYEGRAFEGRVTRINPAADPATGQVGITVAIPNSAGSLVAGLFAEGRVSTVEKSALAVPVSAVDERGMTPAVLRVRSARVERVPVTLGVRDEVRDLIEISGPVARGDTVLLGTAQGIAEGTVVRVRQESGRTVGQSDGRTAEPGADSAGAAPK
jgi:membrane fusion protein (multidrug efflux system)